MSRPDPTTKDAGSRHLPAHYRLADRSSEECIVVGCADLRVRGITICPEHEYAWDELTKEERGALGWEGFIHAAATTQRRT